MNTMRRWWGKATPAQKRTLAKLAKTTVGTLHQLAGGYRTRGVVRASPELARRIEIASGGELRRVDLCPACRQCEFAKRCGQ